MQFRVGCVRAEQVLVGLNKRDPSVFDMHRINLKTGELTLDTENPGEAHDMSGYWDGVELAHNLCERPQCHHTMQSEGLLQGLICMLTMS